jgi:hypothetical protein
MLTTLGEMPPDVLEVPSHELYRVLKGPTLVHLPGRRSEPLFVSVLLHGNEDTGFVAVQRLLKKYRHEGLPRALSVLIGNVEAARYCRRRLDHQPDYNRVWTGEGTAEHGMAREVLRQMKERKVFASIDIHNNTGVNPHYACVNRLEHRFFHLALLFGRTVVYFIRPQGVQTIAFADLCPSVTVECGHVGDAAGIDHAVEFLNAALHLQEIPEHPVPEHDMGLFHTVATVKLPEGASFGFGKEEGQFRFIPNLDHINFHELPVHTQIGWIRPESQLKLQVIDESGNDVSERYFDYPGGEIRTKVPIMPSMFTLNKEVIRQDVFGYLMERIQWIPLLTDSWAE